MKIIQEEERKLRKKKWVTEEEGAAHIRYSYSGTLIIEQYMEWNGTFVNFVDFRKAFDSRESLWHIIANHGIPRKIVIMRSCSMKISIAQCNTRGNKQIGLEDSLE